MKKYRILFTALLLIAPALTYAVFQDIEISRNNTFSATTLDIKYYTTDSKDSKTFELTPDSNVTITAILKNIGELPNTNTQKYSFIYENSDLAEHIKINGEKLSTYTKEDIDLAKSATKTFTYTFSIEQEAYNQYRGKKIEFYIINSANQVGITPPGGFSDTEAIKFTISIPPAPSLTNSTQTDETDFNLIDRLLEESNLTSVANA